MAETKTEEEKKKFIEDLKKIALRKYGKEYHYLCADKKRIVRTLYESGFLDDMENG